MGCQHCADLKPVVYYWYISGFGATITAPVLRLGTYLGMAVDTNVIIFESIKEELTRGKSYQTCRERWLQALICTGTGCARNYIATAVILFTFGIGPVLGFATTQIMGILLSLFCGILVSRCSYGYVILTRTATSNTSPGSLKRYLSMPASSLSSTAKLLMVFR